MTDYPERIIARIDYDGDVDGQWLDASAPKPHSFGHYFGEYIRADLVDAQDAAWAERVAALEAAVAAARAEGMRRADTELLNLLDRAVNGPWRDSDLDRARVLLAEASK